MSERALRGTRLGATSYETDSGIDLAPRQEVEYACPSGHRFHMPFSVEAEVPAVWECRVCGAQALRVGGTPEEDKPGKPARTHWDMLLERRSIPELEDVLAERLEVLRGGTLYTGLGARKPSSKAPAQTPPVNMATGAPVTTPTTAAVEAAVAEISAEQSDDKTAHAGKAHGATASGEKAEPATAKARTATKKTVAKKPPAKKTAAGTAPAKKTTAGKTPDRPAKKTAAKKPSAK